MAKSEFAFATVKTVKPLTIVIDGDTSALPAVAYGVTVKEKQRVEVRVRKPPQPPLITRVLNAKTSTLPAVVSLSGEALLPDPATVSGWTLIDGDGFTLGPDVLLVDPDVYPDGTVFAMNTTLTVPETSPEQTWDTWVAVTGIVANFSWVSMAAYLGPRPSLSPNIGVLAAMGVGTVIDGGLAISLASQLTNPSAPASGSIIVSISGFPIGVSG